uniref:Gastrula zinc finger protein XlCGF57.1-like n=1 Tax=Salvator merianae TaxID=96440 RepID=A0A8D0AXW2_SALMN
MGRGDAAASGGAGRGPPPAWDHPGGGEQRSCRGSLSQDAAVTLEDVTVSFSPEEWAELEEWQRQLHQDVMRENGRLIASLGCDLGIPGARGHGKDLCVSLLGKTSQGPEAGEETLCPLAWGQDGTAEAEEQGRPRPGLLRCMGRGPGGEECPLTCPDCGKHFRSRAGRLAHQRIHTGERPFACGECGRAFTQRQHLGTHLRVHRGERPFACGECSSTFRLQKLLLTHQRKAHSGELPLACADCGKLFNHKHHLMTHQRVHTGERPFPCPVCGKRFTQKHHLQTHQRGHSGDRPFPCPECGKSFKDRTAVLMHQIVHTGAKPFACQSCSKIFSHKHHLVIHQRVHTGEKPFSCEVCQKRFTQKHHLLSHERIHTGERPYHCQECPRSFKDRITLKLHVRLHTGEKPFCCAQCGERFRLRKALLSHHRLHEPPTELICTECGESFPRMRSLAAHRRRVHPSAPKETAARLTLQAAKPLLFAKWDSSEKRTSQIECVCSTAGHLRAVTAASLGSVTLTIMASPNLVPSSRSAPDADGKEGAPRTPGPPGLTQPLPERNRWPSACSAPPPPRIPLPFPCPWDPLYFPPARVWISLL